jgi:hypothetical protein
MRLLALWAVAVATVLSAAGTAHADDPTPPTPYQIPTNAGPVLGGVQTYQPTCLVAPLACGLRYDPATGTWQPGTGSP